MKRFVRTAGLTLVALAATLLLALQTVLGASAGADTLLVMGGNDNGGGANMEKELSGYFSGAEGTPYAGYTLTKVPWTATSGGVSLLFGGKTYDDSQADGVEKISAAIARTLAADPEGQIVVVGYSSSANVITKLVRKLQAESGTPGTPSPANVSFLVFGNPNRPNGGLLGRFAGLKIPFPFDITFDGESAPSNYKVTDIAWQYDGYADFPKDTRNLLAVVNALIGIVTLHGFYYDADPSNPDNIVSDYTEGNTRYVTLKSSLPLLAGLYGLGIPPQLLSGLDSFLRSEIEKAYDRSVPVVSTVTAARRVSSLSTASTTASASTTPSTSTTTSTSVTPAPSTESSPSATSPSATTETTSSTSTTMSPGGEDTTTSGTPTSASTKATTTRPSTPTTSGTSGAGSSNDDSSPTRTVAPAA
ncbi:PE-PPE domain-containing protein [Williamsia herbipolensis]|uniref:PE-PPE domain-containing protein n=1 Tax=Williamsia herbipolensis TaxID=1603258 RepID=A0AAU4K7T1_9NOCA|nr:PE-PPE domain-containing protein [Williamsia herbipolensis]